MDRSLTEFEAVGFERREERPAPGVAIPGGSCWACGQAIINCVIARSTRTGETITVGVDCAERIGLDAAQIRALQAERRAADQATSRASRKAAAAAREAEATARFGEHGTPGRHQSGCRCVPCRAAAAHGTVDRVEQSGCTCGPCVTAAVDSGSFEVVDRNVLLDAVTGEVLDAQIVSTRYGLRWKATAPDGTETWYPFSPKRRSTLADRGVLEASGQVLVTRPSTRSVPPRQIGVVSVASTDIWGTTLPHMGG